MSSNDLQVLYLPYYGDANEYQNLLTSSVSESGVEPVKREMSLFFPLVRNVVAHGDIDIVHLIWTHPFFIVGGVLPSSTLEAMTSYVRAALFLLDFTLARLLGVKFVWTVHNKQNHERYHIELDHWISRFLAERVGKMTVECERAKTVVADLFEVSDPSKIEVIEEGSYIGSYEDEISRENARDQLGAEPDETIVVYFGQIRDYKKVPTLIETFSAIDPDDARLVIAGNPYTDVIEADIRRRTAGRENITTTLKFIPNEDVQVYMRGADVVALPYEDIMTSGSVLLSMSFGRPVVTPAIGCIPEVLAANGGFLYEQDEPSGFESALRSAIETSRDELAEMGEANYEYAQEFTWDAVGSSTVELYREVVRN